MNNFRIGLYVTTNSYYNILNKMNFIVVATRFKTKCLYVLL
jgi:hypothetical protein